MAALGERVRTPWEIAVADNTKSRRLSPFGRGEGGEVAAGGKTEDGSTQGQTLHGTRYRSQGTVGRSVAGARRSWRTVPVQSRTIRHAWGRPRRETHRASLFDRLITI